MTTLPVNKTSGTRAQAHARGQLCSTIIQHSDAEVMLARLLVFMTSQGQLIEKLGEGHPREDLIHLCMDDPEVMLAWLLVFYDRSGSIN